MDPNAKPKPRLSSEGQLFVSLAAAEQWQRANDYSGVEEARRDLTELLLDAYRTDDPDRARLRKKDEGLDLTARLAREGRLLVVTNVEVRELNRGDVAGQKARRRIVR